MPPFVATLPVRFADVDQAGIVYYPRFFHFFHLAFEELWRARRGDAAYAALITERRIGFPAVRAECDYLAPLRFGDVAEVAVRVARRGRTSITFGYDVTRAADRTVCARGLVVCAVVDLARFAAIAPPADVLEVVAGLDAQAAAPGAPAA